MMREPALGPSTERARGFCGKGAGSGGFPAVGCGGCGQDALGPGVGLGCFRRWSA